MKINTECQGVRNNRGREGLLMKQFIRTDLKGRMVPAMQVLGRRDFSASSANMIDIFREEQ